MKSPLRREVFPKRKNPALLSKDGVFQISRSYSCFIALILTPGPMVEAATQERMY